MKKRFVKAVVMVLGLASLLSIGTIALASAQDCTIQANQAYVNKLWERIQKGEKIAEAMKSVGFKSLEKWESGSFPNWLTEEILPGESVNKSDTYGNSDLSIVSFRVNCSVDEAVFAVMKDFYEKGWEDSGSKDEVVATLSKQKGECRWMMVEFVEFGNQTCVVLRIKRA